MSSQEQNQIQDFQKQTVKTIRSFKVGNVRIDLFNFATIEIQLFDESNNIAGVEFLTLTGDDYKNWGNDDGYIVEMVYQKFGFNKPTPTPSE